MRTSGIGKGSESTQKKSPKDEKLSFGLYQEFNR